MIQEGRREGIVCSSRPIRRLTLFFLLSYVLAVANHIDAEGQVGAKGLLIRGNLMRTCQDISFTADSQFFTQSCHAQHADFGSPSLLASRTSGLVTIRLCPRTDPHCFLHYPYISLLFALRVTLTFLFNSSCCESSPTDGRGFAISNDSRRALRNRPDLESSVQQCKQRLRRIARTHTSKQASTNRKLVAD